MLTLDAMTIAFEIYMFYIIIITCVFGAFYTASGFFIRNRGLMSRCILMVTVYRHLWTPAIPEANRKALVKTINLYLTFSVGFISISS